MLKKSFFEFDATRSGAFSVRFKGVRVVGGLSRTPAGPYPQGICHYKSAKIYISREDTANCCERWKAPRKGKRRIPHPRDTDIRHDDGASMRAEKKRHRQMSSVGGAYAS